MRMLQKLGVLLMVAGFFAISVGGMSIHRGPDGTCVRVNSIHGVGGGLMLCGMTLSFIAAFAGGRDSAKPNSAPDTAPR